MRKYSSLFWTGAFFPIFITVSSILIMIGSRERKREKAEPEAAVRVDTVYLEKAIAPETLYIHTPIFCRKPHCETQNITQSQDTTIQ